jgi:pSer/pThr/pTyr-binding forkhead associated (FHA) protein
MSDARFFLTKVADGREVELTGELTIGRAPDSDLRLTEGNPSRRHARLLLNTQGVQLEDLKSTNGTYINGSRVAQQARLAAGDRIRFDIEEFVLRVESALAPASVAIAGSPTAAGAEAARLMIGTGTDTRTIALAAGRREWRIGSDDGRDVRLEYDGVTGLHARIVNAGKVWKVVDEDSAQGTRVNGERVSTRYLHSGDRISFGPVETVFEAPGLPMARRAAEAADTGALGEHDFPPMRGGRSWLIAGASVLGAVLLALVWLRWR